MSFRNFKCIVPRHTNVSSFVVVQGDKLVVQDLDVKLPRSCDYSLKDLLAAGVPVAQVDTTVIHDNSSTLVVANKVIDNSSILDVDNKVTDNSNN